MRQYHKNGKSFDSVEGHFDLFCDICGTENLERDVVVQEYCPEEGYPEGDYCDECLMCMTEQGFSGKDNSIYIYKTDVFLDWARLKFPILPKMVWTGNNEYFSPTYFNSLVDNGYIFPGDGWYYKGKGKIFDETRVFKYFPLTSRILDNKDGVVLEDWFGKYFLNLASSAGKNFHEKTFVTPEMYDLPAFLERNKPKGAVLSFISPRPCAYDLTGVLGMFSEIDYFKLLFVGGEKEKWVLAYST